jgi:predicted dehydrogenase
MLGHVVLFNSEFRQLCREVSTLSPIQYLTAARHRPDSIPSQFPGENPLIATMVHDLYLVRALLDSAEPVGWQARYHRNQDGQLDLATARLEFPGGRLADLVASYLAPSGMAPRGFDRLEVFGSGWAARLEPNPRPLQLWDTRARWPLALEIQTSPDFATGMLAEELRCFCRVVRGSQAVPAGATYADGLAIQRWMEWLAEDATNAEALPKPTNAHD